MIINMNKPFFGGIIFFLFLFFIAITLMIKTREENNSLLLKEPKLSDKNEIDESKEDYIAIKIKQNQDSIISEDIKKSDNVDDRYFTELIERDIISTSYQLEDNLELKRTLENLKESDRKQCKKWDIPENILSETSTDQLFLHFIRSPMVALISMYPKREIGIQRLLNASDTLHELYIRPNIVEGVMKMYNEYDLSPESISDESMIERYSRDERAMKSPQIKEALEPNNILRTKIANICMIIMDADSIILSEQFFPKLKGHEREFLKILVERYEKINDLQEIYGDDKYGAALGFVPQFCLGLAENLDMEFYNKLKDIKLANEKGMFTFMHEVKNYLKNR